MTPHDDAHEAAASWRLRRERGMTHDEAETFRHWLNEPANSQAYDAVCRAWRAFDDVSAPELAAARRRARRPRPWRRPAVMRMAATLMMLVLLGAGFGLRVLDSGERHAAPADAVHEVLFDDGSLVVLDAGAVLRARYTRSGRDLRLERGQARFVVAPDPQRPFRVDVGDDQVTAVGTIFNIARTPDRATITLIEGLVDVGPTPGWFDFGEHGDPIRLAPGQQVVLTPSSAPVVTRVRTQDATVWRHELTFVNVTLAEAVEQVNKYADVPVSLSGPDLADLRISGAFNHGDSRGFAEGVRRLYGLKVVETDESLTLQSEHSG